MHMYFVSMSLRVVCVASLFWVRGWWVVIPVLGSIFLPWFAVMIGNAKASGGEQAVNSYAPLTIEGAPAEELPADPDVLVVDVDPVRRSGEGAQDSPVTDPNRHDDPTHARKDDGNG